MLCLLLALPATACKKAEDPPSPSYTPGGPTEPTEQYEKAYSNDKLINRFFTEYVAMFGDQLYNTHRDPNDLNASITTINQCQVTVRNVSETKNGLHIIIEGGHTQKSLQTMMGVFSKITRSIDTGCTEKMINAAVAHLTAQTSTVQDYRPCNYVKVLHYSPINEEVGVPCRIELLAMNYQLPPEE